MSFKMAKNDVENKHRNHGWLHEVKAEANELQNVEKMAEKKGWRHEVRADAQRRP